MNWRLLILLLLNAFVCNSVTFAQDQLPYIYYYSPELNAMIVERADGTDTRVFGQGMNIPTFGPGFSPNGDWFASSAGENVEGSSSILSVRGTTVLRQLLDLSNVWYMDWSSNSRYILVSGSFDSCVAACRYITSLMINVEENDLVAAAHFLPSYGGPRTRPIEWSQDNESVSFYMIEDLYSPSGAATFQVTMYSSGDVIKHSTPYEEYDLANPPIDESSPIRIEIEHISPDGRYSISAYHDFTDRVTGAVTELPKPEFPEGADVNQVMHAQWDASGQWVMLGYGQSASGFWGLAIMRADGSEFRTLNYSLCRTRLGGACAGWLPDNVDVDSIPLLTDAP
ncbi:MAG TPA: hypothetical protein VER79_05415 [Candidatus Limnocylindrales bacterium]|nr:hypothetical protein [Candidatus Limnocylindrales bacterium]